MARRPLLALLACLLLAACSGVPTSGVATVPERPFRAADAYVHVRAPGPEPDLTPLGVLNRFLVASGGFDSALARVRDGLRERRDAMLEALEQELPEGSTWTRPDSGPGRSCATGVARS